MKNFFRLTLAVVLMLSTSTVFAQKFGRVDMASVLTNMAEYKEAQTNLEAYGADLQNQLEQIMVEYNKLYADYEKNAATYSDSVRQLKEREIMEVQQRYADFQQIAGQDMQKKQSELMAPIIDKANEAVSAVAKSAGYIAIFNIEGDVAATAGLAYFDASQLTNITDQVMTKLGITPKK